MTSTSGPTPDTGNRRAWKTAVLGGMASFLDAGTIVATGTALVLYQEPLGLSPWDIGALSALLTLSLAIGAFSGGRLGDIFGRRRVFSVDLLVFAGGLIMLTAAPAPWMLYVGVIVTGFAMGADLPTSLALIAEEAPEKSRGKMVALSQALWVGGIAGSQIVAAVVSGLGETGGRLLYAYLAVIALVVWALRRRLPESGEWTTARAAARTLPTQTGSMSLADTRRLLRAPLVWALVATGLFYGIGNLAANTLGQFQTYLFVNVAGVDVGTAALIGLIGLPLGVTGAILFMRVVDRKSRMAWFVFGAVLLIGACTVPLVFGFSLTTMVILAFGSGFGGPFAGEAIYKVWSQELFPTLLRSTAQGATIAFCRVLAAGFAFVTPAIATNSPATLVGIMLGVNIVAAVIGFFWVAKLPKHDAGVSDVDILDTPQGEAVDYGSLVPTNKENS